MVNIIEENRPLSVGQRFAKAFQGIGEAIPEALGQMEKEEKERRLQIAKRKAKIRPALKSFLSLYDKNQAFRSNPESMEALEELAHKYSEQGFEPDEAITEAYRDIMAAPSSKRFEEEPTLFEKGKGSFSGEGMGFFDKIGKWTKEEVGPGLAKGIRPLVQLADFPFQLARESGYGGRGKDFKTITDYYDELTGGRGIPQNVVERIAAGYPLGVPGIAGAYAEEALEGLPEPVKKAGGIVAFLAAHKIKIPELKSIIGEAKKVGKATGKSTEEVLQTAQKESRVSLEKVAQGDKEAVNSLKNKITEVPKGAEKVSELPKTFFKKKAAEKQREVFGAKLAESPLDEYYGIKARELEKERAKRPETLQREKEIRERLAPEETKLYTELQNQKDELKRIDQARRKADSSSIERIETLHKYQLKKINETTEALKDIQYEMKYARPRPTEAEIDAQIQKSVKEFEEAILNPTEKTEKAVFRQLELDKQYIDRASKLVDRGELPGEIRPDTFIKMKQKYLDGYKTAIEKAKEQIRALKGETDAASLKMIADKQKFVSRLSDRVKRLESDIVNQTDNIKAMRALEKPSGAFYKQQLKSLKKDNTLFKDDLFRQKRIKGPSEIKAQKAFKEGTKDIQKGKELIENPTKENIQKAAAESGKTESEFTKALKEVKEEVKSVADKVKSGTVTPNVEAKFNKRIKHLAAYIGSGYAAGLIQGAFEEYFHFKPDARIMRFISTLAGLGSFGTSYMGYKHARDFFDASQAEELSKLRSSPKAWNDYINNMEKKYGKAKVRRVLKIVNENKS